MERIGIIGGTGLVDFEFKDGPNEEYHMFEKRTDKPALSQTTFADDRVNPSFIRKKNAGSCWVCRTEKRRSLTATTRPLETIR